MNSVFFIFLSHFHIIGNLEFEFSITSYISVTSVTHVTVTVTQSCDTKKVIEDSKTLIPYNMFAMFVRNRLATVPVMLKVYNLKLSY